MTMDKDYFIKRFDKSFIAYIIEPQEEHLMAISELGKDLIKAFVPPEEIGDIFEASLKKLHQHFSGITLNELTERMIAPLVELLIAYGLSFREQIEKKQREEINQLERARAKAIYDIIIQPRLPVISGIGVNIECLPAESIGGDILEFFQVNDHKLLFFLADVTGHGVPAAMTANILKILFNEIAQQDKTPSEIFTYLNKRMHLSILPDDMIAAFCGLIDIETMTLIYSLAGIPSPFLMRDNEIVCLKPTSLPIGVFEDVVYSDNLINLSKNDLLIAFTDGITETRTKNGNILGIKGLQKNIMLIENNMYKVVDAILTSAIQFQKKEEFNDDVVIFAIKLFEPDEKGAGNCINRFSTAKKLIYHIKTKFIDIDETILMLIKDIKHRTSFKGEALKELKLVLFEMIMNAIEHGHLKMTKFKQDPSLYDTEKYWEIFHDRQNSSEFGEKLIRIECIFDSSHIQIAIEDEGEGFNLESVIDPLNVGHITKFTGRGIFLARKNADSISYIKKGNKVILIKNYNR